MYIVSLLFTEARGRAKDYMAQHNAWLQQGFDDGIFVLAGSIKPAAGGVLLGPVDTNYMQPVVTKNLPIKA